MPRTSLPAPVQQKKTNENLGNKNLTKAVPGQRRARYGSTLSTRDPNTKLSKSSVSSIEETFHTALKDQENKQSSNYNKSKVYRNSTFSNREKENLPKVDACPPDVESASPKLRRSDEILLVPSCLPDAPLIETNDVPAQESLPDGVLNICIDEGLYEYSQEVCVYLQEVEKPLPIGYLDSGSITSNMRKVLVDWLIQVQHHLKLTQESLYLCVNLLDTVLHERDVDPDKLQLVGITSLLIATKLEEYYPAEIGKLLHLTENSYTRKDVLVMERVVFQVLKFQCYIPTAQTFLLKYTRAALRSDDDQFYETCCFIIDSQLILPTHPCYLASETAAAATLLSLLLYHVAANRGQEAPKMSQIWTETLVFFSGFQCGEILEQAILMVDQMIAACKDDCKYKGAIHKYQSNSQHKKLAYEAHVQEEILIKAREVLKLWRNFCA